MTPFPEIGTQKGECGRGAEDKVIDNAHAGFEMPPAHPKNVVATELRIVGVVGRDRQTCQWYLGP